MFARRAELKRKLRSRERIFAAWSSLGHPSATEVFARSGVDFVGIDMEHSTISQEEARRNIVAGQAGGALCLPRIATHDNAAVKRLLDSGADGIIAPNVDTGEQAETLLSFMKYPPLGKRGFGVARCQGYGFDFDEYVAQWNDHAVFIAQVESITSVENIDGILVVDGVDGVMVGPYDMSGSLGIPGQIHHEKVQGAAARAIEACKRHGKACGTHLVEADPEGVAKAFEAGYTFVVLGSDVFMLWKWGEQVQAVIAAMRA